MTTPRTGISTAEHGRENIVGGSNGPTWTERLKEAARSERIKGYQARLDSLLLSPTESPENASSLPIEILKSLFREIKSPEKFWYNNTPIDGIRLSEEPLAVSVQRQKEVGYLVLLFPQKKENQGFCLCEELKPFITSSGEQGKGYDKEQGYLIRNVRKGHQEVFGNATEEEKKILIKMTASAILKKLGIE